MTKKIRNVVRTFFEKCKELVYENIKYYVKTNSYSIELIDKHKIEWATLEMLKQLQKQGITDFNIDNMKIINSTVFDFQEKYYFNNKNYMLLFYFMHFIRSRYYNI